ncbi:MAG TPA: hypothetical protein GX528_06990, partial [Firmicutes bacterium]|nr:hypothetical protein [Bacillota bacterium]
MEKRWLVFGLIMVLLFNLVGTSAVLAKVTDITPDHWAYRAVVTLVNRGYLQVYEDGTFQGDRAVNRFTLAVALAQILEEIEAGKVKGTTEDLDLIKQLYHEFEAELALWYQARESLDEDVAFVRQSMAAVEERVRLVGASQIELGARMEEALEAISQLESHVGVQKEDLVDYKVEIEAITQAVIELEKELREQEQDLQYLNNWKEEKEIVIAALQLKMEDDIEKSIQTLGQRNLELEKDLQTLAIRLQREAQKVSEVTGRLEQAGQDLASLEKDFLTLHGTDELLEELRDQLISDLNVQVNAALIREKRLERQISELEEEFESYRETAEKELKSSKTMTTVALAVAAVGVVIAVMGGL